MIERVYIKDYITFKEAELEFSKGLMVFTGPSGAGKSVLMRGILSIFGFFSDNSAMLSEAVVDTNIDLEKYGIENDEVLIFRQVKKNKNRYFINNQAVSKKIAREISLNFLDYLSLREIKEFENENILSILDKMLKEKEYYVKLEKYKKLFQKHKKLKIKLNKILKEKKEAEERKKFLKYELEKIENISPQPGEFEKLMKIKKDLSKIEKIKEKANEIEKIFEFESIVFEFLEIMEENGESFYTLMNELRIIIDKAKEKASYLENVDIEKILDRLSLLQDLIRRFGSIEEALKFYEEKKEELDRLENLEFEKKELIEKLDFLEKNLNNLAEYLTHKRKIAVKKFEKKMNYFLKKLYMPTAKIILENTEINEFGKDKVEIIINNIDINTISTGEFNRLRVAFLASKLEYEENEKSLFLDEIDANLSGEESMSVAEVLKYLSTKYQIFTISHHPQLASQADKHFLILKENNTSYVKELNEKERIKEIARIMGGKEKSKKAMEYAMELLMENT